MLICLFFHLSNYFFTIKTYMYHMPLNVKYSIATTGTSMILPSVELITTHFIEFHPFTVVQFTEL